MFIEKVLIFVLFLGPLVFFHELGHFLFARLFGVRVEVFSIGFGPKFFKFKKGDTEYALSLIPLGGYVKMYGDDPFKRSEIPDSMKSESFIYKGKWARFCIVFGGPLANFIMAYVLFFGLLVSGEKIPEMRLGVIEKESKFYTMGIRTGDIISKVNGKNIYNPADMAIEEGNILNNFEVLRDGKNKIINSNIKGADFFKELVNYPPGLLRPIVVNKFKKYFAISLNSKNIDWNNSLDTMARQNLNGKIQLYLFALDEKNLTKNLSKIETEGLVVQPLVLNINSRSELYRELGKSGFRPIDLVVKNVNKKSPAEDSGLKISDTIIGIDGKMIYNFTELRSTLQSIEKEVIQVAVWSDGSLKNLEIRPEIKEIRGVKRKLIGVHSAGLYLKSHFIDIPGSGFLDSLIRAGSRTIEGIYKTMEGFKKLITGEVSFKAIGGPLTIGKVAADSFNTSLTYFFQLMAMISINLGVINLFPIPVLDGGHIMFIILEILNRGPVSRRKMEIAQQVGLSLLLMLMIGALFNDFSRFF